MFNRNLRTTALAAMLAATFFTTHTLRADDNNGPTQNGDNQQGQNAPPQERGPRLPPEIARTLSQLQLTDDQKAQVKKLAEAFRKKQEELRKQLLSDLKSVLTDDQYKQIEQSIQQPPPPPQGGAQNGPGGQGGQGNDQGGGGQGNGPGGDMPPPPPNN